MNWLILHYPLLTFSDIFALPSSAFICSRLSHTEGHEYWLNATSETDYSPVAVDLSKTAINHRGS